MLLFGMDEELNSDADASLDDGLTLFSVRGIVSMLCITGWSGYALLETPLPEWASVLISVVLGIATLLAMAFLMRALQRLQSSGNIEIANAVGKVGQVYIPIPANASAAGKVNITVQEKYSEFSAITMGDEALPTGTYVRVVAVDDVGTLVVERLAGK
jgi:membrane protein implicated in regulation of membrane protease activity